MRIPSQPSPKLQNQGFTFLELMVTILIIAILASTLSIGITALKDRANRVACMGNLRTLHQAFASYTSEKGYWPQEPEDLGSEGYEFYGWLIGEVSPYGGGRNAWICPKEKQERALSITDEEFVGSYVPTMFGPVEGRPWEWNQPWLIERGNLHRSGALYIMPDGSIQTTREPIY